MDRVKKFTKKHESTIRLIAAVGGVVAVVAITQKVVSDAEAGRALKGAIKLLDNDVELVTIHDNARGTSYNLTKP
jgi:hypothetical protein